METTNYTRSRPVIVNEANMMFKRPIHNVLTGLGMLGVFFMGWWAWYVFGGSEKAEQRAIQAAKDYVEQTYSDPKLHVTDVMYLSLYDPNYHGGGPSDGTLLLWGAIRDSLCSCEK